MYVYVETCCEMNLKVVGVILVSCYGKLEILWEKPNKYLFQPCQPCLQSSGKIFGKSPNKSGDKFGPFPTLSLNIFMSCRKMKNI
jgi:hypothetical protein